MEILKLLTIKQASEWASNYTKKNVTPSNISYLIQYGKVKKIRNNGNACVNKQDLMRYYDSFLGRREIRWKGQLGEDLNWALSFDHLKEADTTKHVHRLHPYKGKFIPQLVEYFLDNHVDDFKTRVYFKKGDIVLDPFCGSGTTLVQASELKINAIGIDISTFNAFISNIKIGKYDLSNLQNELQKITKTLKQFIVDSNTVKFENRLLEELAIYNNKYFPSPYFKYRIRKKEIDGDKYGEEKANEFLSIYNGLIGRYNIELKQESTNTFLDKWFLKHVRSEIDFVFSLIQKIKNTNTKKVASVILSRAVRSCRATTHFDLATLKEPVVNTYYCPKHGKICKPLFSILNWWERYGIDTISRLKQFESLRTNTQQICLKGDSRSINILDELEKRNPILHNLVKKQKIKGIFSSPPYVGLIDYHEQHAYAYDLFGFKRNDELEIGPLYKGQGREARDSYLQGISDTLINCKMFLSNDYDIFLVANDKYNLYPIIAEKSGMKIVNTYKRPVLNRTERDKAAYAEIIFHLKEK